MSDEIKILKDKYPPYTQIKQLPFYFMDTLSEGNIKAYELI